MSLPKETIFEAALALSDVDRAALTEQLLETLSPEQEEDEEALAGELERRRAEVEQGTAGVVSWAELKQQE